MATSPSLLVIVFLLFGFICFMGLPPLLAIAAQRSFSNRFERLVRSGHILPVFQPLEAREQAITPVNGISGRIRVTLKSLIDVWIRPQPYERTVPEIDWKVSSAFSSLPVLFILLLDNDNESNLLRT
jgi:hypothetical protein